MLITTETTCALARQFGSLNDKAIRKSVVVDLRDLCVKYAAMETLVIPWQP